MLTQKEQNLLDAIEALAVDHGIEVVTLEVTGAKKSPTVRVYIDTDRSWMSWIRSPVPMCWKSPLLA